MLLSPKHRSSEPLGGLMIYLTVLSKAPKGFVFYGSAKLVFACSRIFEFNFRKRHCK